MDLLSIIRFLIILSILVFVHELGHFAVAKFFGIRVKEFGLGFPPRAIGKKYNGTIYSLNWLPIGGFVSLYGENASVEKDRARAYYHKGKFVRAAVVCAGVFMNFLLAVLAFATITWVTGIPTETGHVTIKEVVSGSPAEAAKVQPGDIVRQVNGQVLTSTKQFTDYLNTKKGQEVNLEIERSGQVITTKLTPRTNPPVGQGPIGVAVSSSELRQPPLLQRPFIALKSGFDQAVLAIKITVVGLADAFSSIFRGHIPEGVGGPVQIYRITNEVAKEGVLSLISLVGLISINLAVLNIAPFPALDGGRLLFIIIELLTGRRDEKIEGYVHYVGMIILLTLILGITFNDFGGFSAIKNFQLPH